jgi:hypothetical protein
MYTTGHIDPVKEYGGLTSWDRCIWQPTGRRRAALLWDTHGHGRQWHFVDRVGDRCAHTTDAELADARGFHRRRDRVGLVQEDHVLVRDVGMDWRLVAREVVVDEEASPRVDGEFIVSGGSRCRQCSIRPVI